MGIFGKKDTPGNAESAPIAEYKVIYRGGLPELPKAKVGGIMLRVWADAFAFEPTTSSKKFWQPLAIPFAAITDVQVVTRQISGAEAFLSSGSGGGTRDLQTDNNLHFHYVDASGQPLILRVEMLTGVTVSGQAKKAAEFNDLLQTQGIRAHFRQASASAGAAPSGVDNLAKLGEMFQQGLLTQAEFDAAKAKALGL